MSKTTSVVEPPRLWSFQSGYLNLNRSTVVIDPQGKVRLSWPKAKAKGHAAEVLQALRKIAS